MLKIYLKFFRGGYNEVNVTVFRFFSPKIWLFERDMLLFMSKMAHKIYFKEIVYATLKTNHFLL
jgi:hypothetical protein